MAHYVDNHHCDGFISLLSAVIRVAARVGMAVSLHLSLRRACKHYALPALQWRRADNREDIGAADSISSRFAAYSHNDAFMRARRRIGEIASRERQCSQ